MISLERSACMGKEHKQRWVGADLYVGLELLIVGQLGRPLGSDESLPHNLMQRDCGSEHERVQVWGRAGFVQECNQT